MDKKKNNGGEPPILGRPGTPSLIDVKENGQRKSKSSANPSNSITVSSVRRKVESAQATTKELENLQRWGYGATAKEVDNQQQAVSHDPTKNIVDEKSESIHQNGIFFIFIV